MSTRAVAAAAGVKVPTIYRQFGDKSGLLDAVTALVMRNYLRDKRKAMADRTDPIVDLRHGWDAHVDFGLSNPGCYSLIYGRPHPGKMSSAATETIAILRQAVGQLGAQGRLRMSVEPSTRLLHAAAVGFALAQISVAVDERDRRFSVIARENALWSIMNDDPKPSSLPDLSGRAVALREALRGRTDAPMTSAEGEMLAEWLDRLADRIPGRDDGACSPTTSSDERRSEDRTPREGQ